MIFRWNSSFSSSFARAQLEKFRRFKWSSGFSSWVNLILKAFRSRSFRIIRYSVVWAMPNSWERRGIDWFGSFWIDALTAAIISSLRAIRRFFSTGTTNSVNLVSNLSTIARTACRVGRLLRPKIGVSALKSCDHRLRISLVIFNNFQTLLLRELYHYENVDFN